MLAVIQDDPSPGREPENREPWYRNGLHFACTGCGQCCTGAPGYVWVNQEEIAAIAAHLGLTIEAFSERFLRKTEGRFSLIEHPKTFDCVFLKDRKCQIYPVRPVQCQTFPWWPHLLASEKEWKDAARDCEGICGQAPLVPKEEIDAQLMNYETAQHKP